ncbi:HigA family addiction module antitoxin [Pararhodospirillum oryzae]|uniref:Virulence associated protein n=1 Tax=Pararhodospirillum oryzae TaxID=478448 RepID=A0A512H7S7_9PROT|nr:HigA family addiction module antitoxin [Pararhodospirillum oryzae]GEO81509.1 virulence associated protein [Pararhodospirillum oryzae]
MTEFLSPITPGEILKEEFMDPHELTCNHLARDIDVPANRISEIVAGRRAITADTALRLGVYFGIDARFWLNLQAEYDLQVARQKAAVNLEERIRPLNTREHRSVAM